MEWDLADAYQQPNAIQKIKPAAHSRLVCMTYSLTTGNTTAKFYHEYTASIEFNENNETDQEKNNTFVLARQTHERSCDCFVKSKSILLSAVRVFLLLLFACLLVCFEVNQTVRKLQKDKYFKTFIPFVICFKKIKKSFVCFDLVSERC